MFPWGIERCRGCRIPESIEIRRGIDTTWFRKTIKMKKNMRTKWVKSIPLYVSQQGFSRFKLNFWINMMNLVQKDPKRHSRIPPSRSSH